MIRLVLTATLVVVVIVAGVAVRALYLRPQRGLLVVAALTPFHGLLLIVPNGASVTGWKEGLLALTLLATFVTPNRPPRPQLSLPWLPVAATLVVIGCISAFFALGHNAVYPIKITFFYLIVVTLIVWRSPLTARDRDHLVTIIMVASTVTAVWGIAQQILGAEFLVRLGYEYNTVVRSAGPLLRSFSTFIQPFPFGLYVLMGILVGGSVALQDLSRIRNRLFLAAMPVLIVGMGMSIVRAAFLGLIVGMIWLGIHRYRYLFGVLAAATVLGGLVLMITPRRITDSMFSSSSLGQRTAGWSRIGMDVATHPLGQGLGATGSAAEKLATSHGVSQQYLLLLQTLNPELAYQPDNYYVKILLEIGPIGLWLLLLLLGSVAVSALRASRLTVGADSAFCLGVSASAVAACAAALVSTYFEIFPLDFYFWLLAASVGCAVVQGQSECVPEAPQLADVRGQWETSAPHA